MITEITKDTLLPKTGGEVIVQLIFLMSTTLLTRAWLLTAFNKTDNKEKFMELAWLFTSTVTFIAAFFALRTIL